MSKLYNISKVGPVKVGETFVCPDCGCGSFRGGPEGGLSINIECKGCETRWNANFIGLPWERLSTVWERLEAKHGSRT